MRFVAIASAVLSVASSAVFASSATIDVNQDVVHIDFTGQPNPKALEFNAGLFHQDDSSANRSEDNADIYYAGVMTKDKMTNFRDVEFSLGGQIGHLDADDVNGGYAAIAAAAKYFIPDARGVSVAVGLSYAPDVITTDDMQTLMNFQTELAWRVVPKGEVVGGYRHIELDIKQSDDVTFDESWYAGFRLMF